MGDRSGATVRRWSTALLMAGMGVAGSASATLIDRGSNMCFDDVLNVTWLQNANYAATELSDARRDAIIADVGSVAGHTLAAADFQKSGATYTGRMTWWGATAWAKQLVFGGYSDWRLAAINLTSPTGTPHFCSSGTAEACAATGNELGYMYYFELGGAGNDETSIPTSVLGEVTLNNVQSVYWSGTDEDFVSAWLFGFGFGAQGVAVDGVPLSAWAVRPGDVVIAAVPEPASVLLIGVGILGLGWTRRRGAALSIR